MNRKEKILAHCIISVIIKFTSSSLFFSFFIFLHQIVSTFTKKMSIFFSKCLKGMCNSGGQILYYPN